MTAVGKQKYLVMPIELRLLAYVDFSEGCWNSLGSLDACGYGQISVGSQNRKLHRVVYSIVKGDIPAGLQLDHLCRNRACANPSHLEAVSPRENTLRGLGPAATNAQKTHCPAGHEFTPSNTYRYEGERQCRTCRSVSVKNFYERKRRAL